MKRHFRVFLGIFAGLFLIGFGFQALAGWEGELRTAGKGVGNQMKNSRIEIQDSKMRMESEIAGMGRSMFIVDWKKGKASSVLESNRMILEMDLRAMGKAAGGAVPYCDPTKAIEACLKDQSYSKTSSGEANGFECDVYEKAIDEGFLQIWHPTAHADLPAVRTVILGKDRKEEFRSDFVNLVKKTFNPKRFELPKGYFVQDMTAMASAMASAKKGKSKAVESKKASSGGATSGGH